MPLQPHHEEPGTPDLSAGVQVARSMTRGYVAALVLIAATLLGAYLMLAAVLDSGRDGAARIALVERLDLLADDAVGFAVTAARGDDRAAEALMVNLAGIEETHDLLLHGDPDTGTPALPGPLWAVFFDGDHGIDRATGRFVAAARQGLAVSDGRHRMALAVHLAQLHTEELSTVLNRAKAGLVRGTARDLSAASGVQKVSLVLLLVMLAGLAAFVFGPGVRRIRHRVSALEDMALRDPLTGLANRRAFQQDAERELALARRGGRHCAVLMLDIDHFKQVNDCYGHDTGDRVLCRLARRAGETLRASDLLARLGGEEFAVLLVDVDTETALLVADKLRRAISEESDSPAITVSIGVAPADATGTVSDLLMRADGALYRAKEEGRDRIQACRGSTEGVAPADTGRLLYPHLVSGT